MAEFPILPLKVAALLADTHHFTTLEFGAYCRILFGMWLNGGMVPESYLKNFANMSDHNFKKAMQKIGPKLTFIDGIVSQKRLTDTRLIVQEKRRKAAFAAQARWDKEKVMQSHMRMHRPSICSSDATKTSIERKKERG